MKIGNFYLASYFLHIFVMQSKCRLLSSGRQWKNFVSNCSISKVLHIHKFYRTLALGENRSKQRESRIPLVQAAKYKCSANTVNVFIEGTMYDILPVLFASPLVEV